MSDGRFQKGNKLWQRAVNPGQPCRYTPDELWIKAQAYFNYCEATPDVIEELGGKNFQVGTREVKHAPTIMEFCVFANINTQTWFNYAKRPEYIDVCSHIKGIMFSECFVGAASGQLSPNIIARHLGLVDKKEVQSNQNNVVLVIPDNGRLIKPQNQVEISESIELPMISSPDISYNQDEDTRNNDASNQNGDEIGSELML